jgi:hypothetical protein
MIKKVRNVFSPSDRDLRNERRIHIVGIIFIILVVIGYAKSWRDLYIENPKLFRNLSEINYSKLSRIQFENLNYKKHVIFGNTFYLPERFERNITDIDVMAFIDDMGNRIVFFEEPVENQSFKIWEPRGIKSPFEYTQRLMNEKIGIAPLQMKNVSSYDGKVVVCNWRGLVDIENQYSQNEVLYEFSLWNLDESIAIGFVFYQEHFDKQIIENVVSSLCIVNDLSMTGKGRNVDKIKNLENG